LSLNIEAHILSRSYIEDCQNSRQIEKKEEVASLSHSGYTYTSNEQETEVIRENDSDEDGS
jgi:hypothetical protein